MIIFEGDFVRQNGQADWLEVVDIVDSMHIQLSNGACVEASERDISGVLSANEVLSAISQVVSASEVLGAIEHNEVVA